MAKKYNAPLPDNLDLDHLYTVSFAAVDAASGAPMAGVNITGATLIVANLAGTDNSALAFGPFVPLLTPIDFGDGDTQNGGTTG
jgi:hypothetical protein